VPCDNFAGNYRIDDFTVKAATVLPVELVSFAGSIQGASVGLHWQTATEHSNDFFTVERSADSRILLLATHAWFDNAQPDHSAIVLSNENQDNLHDKLFVYELKQLSIPADLVILSACQTAQGRLYRGEGLMSIARAFLYAGAGSVVATRWNADDAETPVLIGHFVKNLCAGMRRSAALTKARYDFMQARQGSGHPYYWAGLMLTGERGVIQDLKGRSFGYWWWSGGAIVVVFLYFFTKKYKKRK
jgi:CHAT domain-containing protein